MITFVLVKKKKTTNLSLTEPKQGKVQGCFSSFYESMDRNTVAITTVYERDGGKSQKHITLITKKISFQIISIHARAHLPQVSKHILYSIHFKPQNIYFFALLPSPLAPKYFRRHESLL